MHLSSLFYQDKSAGKTVSILMVSAAVFIAAGQELDARL